MDDVVRGMLTIPDDIQKKITAVVSSILPEIQVKKIDVSDIVWQTLLDIIGPCDVVFYEGDKEGYEVGTDFKEKSLPYEKITAIEFQTLRLIVRNALVIYITTHNVSLDLDAVKGSPEYKWKTQRGR